MDLEFTQDPDEFVSKQGLVRASRLISADEQAEAISAYIERVENFEQAGECLNNIDYLEATLRHADQFGEWASKFCVLEAKSYIRIAELVREGKRVPEDFRDRVGLRKYRIVMWLAEKGEVEDGQVLALCANGMRIQKVRELEIRAQNALTRKAEYRRVHDEIVDELKEHGTTKLSVESFARRWHGRGKPDLFTVNSFVRQTRTSLLKAGGYGIGDGEGTYVMMEPGNVENAAKAMAVRVASINADLRSIEDLASEFGNHLDGEPLDGISRKARSVRKMFC